MSIQEKTQEDQATTPWEATSRPTDQRKIAQVHINGTHQRWAISILALIALVVAILLVVAVADRGSPADTPAPESRGQLVSDGSFEAAEINRFEVLRDLSGRPVADGSFEAAEMNRFEVLRDLATGSVSDGSHAWFDRPQRHMAAGGATDPFRGRE